MKVNNRCYTFIVPYNLDTYKSYNDEQFDLTLLDDNDGLRLYLTDEDSPKINIGDFFEQFCIKYNLLIDYGEYYFLNTSNCLLLRNFIEEKQVLSIKAFKQIYNIVVDAINFNTGMGLDF